MKKSGFLGFQKFNSEAIIFSCTIRHEFWLKYKFSDIMIPLNMVCVNQFAAL